MLFMFFSTLVYIFRPVGSAKQWLKVTPLQSLMVGMVHLLFLPVWVIAFLSSTSLFDRPRVGEGGVFSQFAHSLHATPRNLYGMISQFPLIDRISAIVLPLLLLFLFYMMLFFVLLPFAARPGLNKPCIRHTLRTTLLATGILHLFCFLLTAVFVFGAFLPHVANNTDLIIRMVLLTVLPLIFWTLAALVRIVRFDYRAAVEMPQPHDPWCDQCGYNLSGIDPEKRCPECGKPILESTGPGIRPPTPWENHPAITQLRIILHQIKLLILRPRELFFSMPTLTGQEAAQRWLLFSALGVAILGFLIMPAIHFCFLAFDLSLADILLRSVAVGLVWALLALMMVGIETSGIATFSRLKHHPGGGVPLATAAKVTAYSSTLMLPWVVLGFAQILASLYWFDADYGPHRHTVRADQVFIALSLAIAHIGGLLWYEFTVYRGIKAIQYANK